MLADVDDADPAQFEKMCQQPVCLAAETVVVRSPHHNQVISDQAMAPVNEFESAFTLPDPWGADDERSQGENVHEHTVKLGPRCEGVLEEGGNPFDRIRCSLPRRKERDADGIAAVQDLVRWKVPLGRQDCWHTRVDNGDDPSSGLALLEGVEVRELGLTKDLNSTGFHIRKKSGECEARLLDSGIGDKTALQPAQSSNNLEVQKGQSLLLEETANRKRRNGAHKPSFPAAC